MQLLIVFALGSFPVALIWKPIIYQYILRLIQQKTQSSTKEEKICAIKALAEHHEVAETLNELIQKDGAGSWPPNTKHTHITWPLPLRPYKEIYFELAPLLPQAEPSLDDKVNIARIAEFRQRFRMLLRERVDLVEVKKVKSLEIVRVYYRSLELTIISFWMQLMTVVGSIFPVIYTTPSIAVSLRVDMRIDGPLSPL